MRAPKLPIAALALLAVACSATVPAPPSLKNSPFPRVRGESLTKQEVIIPDHYRGSPALLLIGYSQKAQFDIDRWILGALQAGVRARIVEVPTIAGMMPQMVQGFINDGMRSGIPAGDWGAVVTVYEDAPKIIAALGNERPRSAYAVLIDGEGRIVWSSSQGYSATQVLDLKNIADTLAK